MFAPIINRPAEYDGCIDFSVQSHWVINYCSAALFFFFIHLSTIKTYFGSTLSLSLLDFMDR